MAYEVIIVMGTLIKQKTQEEIIGTTRSKISMAMYKGVKMSCKAVITQVFRVLDLLVELSTSIVKPNGLLRHVLPLYNLLLY